MNTVLTAATARTPFGLAVVLAFLGPATAVAGMRPAAGDRP